MTTQQDCLIEIGSEELPPKALLNLAKAFRSAMLEALEKKGLSHANIHYFATPRRLALHIEQLDAQQADRQVDRKGPAVKAAFDADGNPTPACLGFARSCGVDVSALQQQETDKGSWLSFQQHIKGQATTDLLPELINDSLKKLPIPKPMRWSDLAIEFVRPIHWILVLWGEQALDANIFGIKTNAHSYGHRFHHPQAITVTAPKNYATTLEKTGYVICDFEKRRAIIEEQVNAAAVACGGVAEIDAALLDEVTGIVEWPTALAGEFEQRFLEVPKEALTSAMQGHQKCFPVVDEKQQLLPYFITVTNIESRSPDTVIKGNQRVMRARLADAAFFYDTDRKQRLDSHLKQLDAILFQAKLGSLADKSKRIAKLSRYIAEQLNANLELAERAGLLSKTDLVTEMVGEFPELQGIMGQYYARHDGENDAVAVALNEQYMPRFSGDELPHSDIGAIVAIADKIDSLVGIFGINQAPTGDKDPFALRRAALGVVRICIEKNLVLELEPLLRQAAAQYNELSNTDVITDVSRFIHDRLKAWYAEKGIKTNLFAAVMACAPTQLLDFNHRLVALEDFRQLPEAEALAAANKRVKNILAKLDTQPSTTINVDLFTEAAEENLATSLSDAKQILEPLFEKADYKAILNQLATMRTPVDKFFDEVMVMAEDQKIRHNRLALLTTLRLLFLQVADISLLQE